jgi:hypothetical protein
VTCKVLYRRVGICLALILCAGLLLAAEPTAEQAKFFEAKIRPILVENCHRCHGEKKQSGELRLDSAAGLIAGGESGPAIIPGDPEKSRLIEAINYGSLEMPPDARLKPEQIKLLTEWVKMGAPWPGSGDIALAPRKGGLVVTDADREHWSFRPVKVQRTEEPKNRKTDFHQFVRNPIDVFILDGLVEKTTSTVTTSRETAPDSPLGV